MAQLTLVHAVFLGILFLMEAQTNTTNLEMSNTTAPPTAAHYVLSPPRRAVLILEPENGTQALRHSRDDTKSLKYIEYDDNGAVLNTVFMYNLKDVAAFFREYLDTKICYTRC